MIYFEINGVDRTADVRHSPVTIDNAIQQRADTASFVVFQGTKPTENQIVRIFAAAKISSVAGVSVVLKNSYQLNAGFFYAGQKLTIGIGESDEETVEVDSYDEATMTVTLVTAPVGTHAENDLIGEIIFGGVVSKRNDLNVEILSNLEYSIECVDYTKIFDSKLVADTWANVDSRYIINSFVNGTVNYNRLIDRLSYPDNAAIQAEWAEASDGNNPTVDASDYLEGSAAGVFGWTFAAGTALWAGTLTSQDVSFFTGAINGAPTKGELMLWVKPSNYTLITSLKVRIGSGSGDYAELTFAIEPKNDWFYCRAKLATAVVVGNPDWTAMDYAQIRIVQTANSSIKINGLRINAEGSFTLFNVQGTLPFDDFRSPQIKPTALRQVLAKTWRDVWYIDYNRDIHFVV